MSLTRDDILKSRSKVLKVEVPDWDGEVFVKKLSVSSVMKFMDRSDKPNIEFFPTLVGITLCDEAGDLLFDIDKDYDVIKELSYDIVSTIGEKALEFNNLSKKSDQAIEKNSEATPSDSKPLKLLDGSA